MPNATQYYKYPFADSGTKDTIPDESVGGAVGFNTGYGPDYELEQGAVGRKRIPRGGHNGLMNGITANLKQWQERSFPSWIADAGSGTPFSYGLNAIVNHNGIDWVSLVSSNTDEPSEGLTWSSLNASGMSDVMSYQLLMRGRSWQDVSDSRVSGVNYTNSTGYEIIVSVSAQTPTSLDGYSSLNIFVNGVEIIGAQATSRGANTHSGASVVIPYGATYRANIDSMRYWMELR